MINVHQSAAMVSATGSATIAGGADEAYVFANPVFGAYVWNHPSSTANLYVVWEGSAASLTVWDAVIEPGGVVAAADNQLTKTLMIYSDANVTLGTNFVVKGREACG